MTEKRFLTYWVFAVAAIFGLCEAVIAATTVTVTQTPWALYRGTSKVSTFDTEVHCIEGAKALGVARSYTCRTSTGVVVAVTVDPLPPPTCTAPQPPAESQSVACPAGSTGTWSQTRTYAAAAYPTCWAPGPWTPATAPAGACTPVVVPPTGTVVYANPPTADMSALNPGDTLILRAGSYTSLRLKACTASAWCHVQAETDGAASISGLQVAAGAYYVSLEGLKFTGAPKQISGSYLKFFRTAFTGSQTSGNVAQVTIGTNDSNSTANILIEDSWVYGSGGRYKVLVYNARNVILRRMVSRSDGGHTNSDGAPEADFTVYDSANVEVQNCIALDTIAGRPAYIAAFYNALNGTTSTPNSVRAWRGNIAINVTGYYMGTEGQTTITGQVVENGALTKGRYGVSQLKGTAVSYSNMTITNSQGDGFGIFGGSATVSNSIVYGMAGQAFNGVSCSSCSTAKPQDLIHPVNGKGATILKKIGVPGTLYGEPGFSDTTVDDLWPWPNEARIKADFDAVRPSFGGKSLTDYVAGALN